MKARASAPLSTSEVWHELLENISCQKSAGGWHKRYRHRSAVLGCDMVFAVYLPPQAEQGGKLPVLYWLSGLTCTDENFMQKAGAHKLAAELGMIIVAPDTSPRGADVPDDPDKAWDFGLGAGFLPERHAGALGAALPHVRLCGAGVAGVDRGEFPGVRQAWHQRPLHGWAWRAGVCLRNPGRYQSLSAFAPISNPS